jgi:hypothetical protein
MATKIKVEFSYGPYGEIIPPPLFTLSGITPEDLNDVVAEMTGDLYDQLPNPTLYHDDALAYLHQQNLLRVLAGEFPDAPDAIELRDAVLNGMRLSLRPLGQEAAMYAGFAPVLQRISDNDWRLGLAAHGQTAVIAGDAPSALRRARQIYVQWAEAEAGWGDDL